MIGSNIKVDIDWLDLLYISNRSKLKMKKTELYQRYILSTHTYLCKQPI